MPATQQKGATHASGWVCAPTTRPRLASSRNPRRFAEPAPLDDRGGCVCGEGFLEEPEDIEQRGLAGTVAARDDGDARQPTELCSPEDAGIDEFNAPDVHGRQGGGPSARGAMRAGCGISIRIAGRHRRGFRAPARCRPEAGAPSCSRCRHEQMYATPAPRTWGAAGLKTGSEDRRFLTVPPFSRPAPSRQFSSVATTTAGTPRLATRSLNGVRCSVIAASRSVWMASRSGFRSSKRWYAPAVGS